MTRGPQRAALRAMLSRDSSRGEESMRRIGWILVGGLIVLTVQATSIADDGRLPAFYSGNRDCSKGTIEKRLDCLTFEVVDLKRRLNGDDGRVLQVGR
jgi:hypothetical protein